MKAFSAKVIHAFERAENILLQLYWLLRNERESLVILTAPVEFSNSKSFKSNFSSFASSPLSLCPPQVDLGFLRFVSAIGTQGAISQETRRIYFVKSYKVDVSSNGEDWITLKEGSKQKVGESSPRLLCGQIFISQQSANHIKNTKGKLSGIIKHTYFT